MSTVKWHIPKDIYLLRETKAKESSSNGGISRIMQNRDWVFGDQKILQVFHKCSKLDNLHSLARA